MYPLKINGNLVNLLFPVKKTGVREELFCTVQIRRWEKGRNSKGLGRK